MQDDQIQHMVSRFLAWKLPAKFRPDNGISFNRVVNGGTEHQYYREPMGTNLLDAIQAAEMVRFMVEGLPATIPMQDDLAGLVARIGLRIASRREIEAENSGLAKAVANAVAGWIKQASTARSKRDAALAEVDRLNAGWAKANADNLALGLQLTATQARLDEAVGIVTALRKDIDDLVDNSAGVAGLHLNGDLADWESLLPDGSFGAWLGSVADADTFLAQQEAKP